MKTKLVIILLLVISSSCQNKAVIIPGLEFSIWRNDMFGCNGYRKENINVLELHKQDFLSYSETEISKNLGTPEKTELIDRSEKYYMYSLDGHQNCRKDTTSTYTYMRVRFNSLGYSKEILILTDKI